MEQLRHDAVKLKKKKKKKDYLQKHVDRWIWAKVYSVQIPDLNPEAALLVLKVL